MPYKLDTFFFLPKVRNTPYELPFLHILQSFVLLEGDDQVSAAIWEVMDQFCSQAVQMKYPDIESDKLKNISIEKLKKILQEGTPNESNTTDITSKQDGQKSKVESVNVEPVPPPPPPSPSVPGGLPPPPPPPGASSGPGITLAPEKMTKIAKSRWHKPQKKMKLINWNKLTRGAASNAGVLWEKAAQGEMDTKVDIDPASVEDLFAKPEIQTKKKDKGEEERVAQAVVCAAIRSKE